MTNQVAYWNDASTDPDRRVCDRSTDKCLAAVTRAVEFIAGHTVLDLGCGVGRLLMPFARICPDVSFIGLDISPDMLTIARWRTSEFSNVKLVLGDGVSLPPGFINAAYSVAVFQHLFPVVAQGYTDAVAGRLKPGGVFRFQVVSDAEEGEFSHKHDGEALAKHAGLSVVDVDIGLVADNWTWITAVKP